MPTASNQPDRLDTLLIHAGEPRPRIGGAVSLPIFHCQHLAKLTAASLSDVLVHRGGLRCQILTDGVVRVGDAISV